MAHTAEAPRTGSVTVTLQEPSSSSAPPEVLTLQLAPRKKKKVRWQPGTVDNEFLGKKSSKKCCIFHKNKSFDAGDSDEEDDNKCKGEASPNGVANLGDGEKGSSHSFGESCSHNH